MRLCRAECRPRRADGGSGERGGALQETAARHLQRHVCLPADDGWACVLASAARMMRIARVSATANGCRMVSRRCCAPLLLWAACLVLLSLCRMAAAEDSYQWLQYGP